MIGALFACAGVATGAAQAALLSRAARAGSGALGLLPRLLLVALVLLLAAREGALVPAAAGWLAGFAAAVALLSRRLR